MIHLVIASDLFKPSIGGTETVTDNMAINLTRAGYRVTVVAPAIKGTKKTPKLEKDPAGYSILRVHSYGLPIQKNLRFGSRAYKQVVNYFSRPGNKVDIVHVNNPFPTSRTLMKYARVNDLPLVIGSHLMPESFTFSLRWADGFAESLNRMGWRYIAGLYNKADMVVAPTKTALKYLTDSGLKVPTRAISNGIDLRLNAPLKANRQQLKEDLGLSSQYVLVYAGRLAVEKRIDVVVTAFSMLYGKYDIELLLIGDGNARKRLEKQCKRLKILDRVKFTGFVQDITSKKKYLAASDIFAIASPVELQSIVTMEAMAAGLPVLAVNAGALPELAQNGLNGATFSDGDAVGLSRLIGDLVHDPVKLKQCKKGSLEIIKGHDIIKTWHMYSQMYKDVIATHSKHNNS